MMPMQTLANQTLAGIGKRDMAIFLYANTSPTDPIDSQIQQAAAAGFPIDKAFADDQRCSIQYPFLDSPAGQAVNGQLVAGDTLLVRWIDVFGSLDGAKRVILSLTDRGVIVRAILFNAVYDDKEQSLRQPAVRRRLEQQWRVILRCTQGSGAFPVSPK